MKKKIFEKAFNIKEISTKEKLALAITVLVLLIVILRVVYSFDKSNEKINYNSFNISEIINISDEVNDNQVFWDLSKIILRIYIFI